MERGDGGESYPWRDGKLFTFHFRPFSQLFLVKMNSDDIYDGFLDGYSSMGLVLSPLLRGRAYRGGDSCQQKW